MSAAEFDNPKQRESLALEVACRRSIRSWARRNGVDATAAYECSQTNKFRALVEVTRLRVADCMVGRLLNGARLAIARLIRLCTKSDNEAIQLAASRALLHHWLKVSELFYTDRRILEMKEAQAAGYGGTRSEKWRPCPPWEL